MKMKKPLIYLAVLCMVILQSMNTKGQNTLTINDVSGCPSTNFTVQLVMNNATPIVAFQLDVPLPTGFTYVNGSITLFRGTANHSINANVISGNTLRILSSSNPNTAYTGNSGVIATFQVTASSTAGAYPLNITNAILADAGGSNVLTGTTNGTATVIALPVAPTSVSATATTICSGQSTTLSYTGGSGTTFGWYTASCGGTLVGTGNNLSVSPTANTTYYGRWENTCGNSTCQSVAITVNPLPVAPTSVSATATTICEGQSTTLSYTGGSGTTFRWFTGSCGGTAVGTGNNLSVSPTVNTTYYGRWENSCGNSTCQSVAITVNPLPVAPTSVSATATTICNGQSTTLSYTGGSGTTFRWFTGSCGGTAVGTGNNLSVSPTVNTTYYGRWENGCGNSTCQQVAITVNALPTAPTSVSATATTICEGQSTTLSYTGGSGTTFRWFTGSCGGTAVGTGNNLSVSPTVNTTYYGRWENTCGNSTCQSVAITVNPLPVAPTSVAVSATPICEGQSTTLSYTGGSGTTFRWFSGSCGGTAVGTGNNLSVSPTVNTTYYGRWENGCGNSTCQNVAVTVAPLPVAPTSVSATATTICSGQSTTLSYTGGSGTTFGWYTASCGGTLVGTGNNLSVSPTVNTTYYGRWENTCGNSTCQSVAITVNPLPVAPTSVSATATTICEGQSTTLSYTGGSGTTFRWFTGSCGGTAVGSGNNLSVSPTVNTTYYGRWENSCGNSTCQQVAITVNPLPVAPTSVSATATTICNGQSTTLSYTGGSGTTFRWFTGSCGGTAVGTGNNLSVSPTVNTTYYGRWENGCGNSTCQQVAITVNPLPVAPTSVSATATTICSGQSTTLSYTGGSGTTFRWFTGSCGGTAVGTGNNLAVSPTVNTTYYGRWENSCGNSTCQQVAITVNPLPVAPTSVSATATTICSGQSTTLSYTGGSGTTFGWYTASCGGTLVGTGNNLSVSPTVNTIYYGRWENSCGNSTCQSVSITVNPLPVAPTSVSASATTVCAGTPTTLSYVGGTGATFYWYSGSCGGTLVGSGNNLAVTPSVNTTYFGRWENSCGNSTCQSVAITVNPLPVAPTSVSATATTICEGQSTTLSYTGGSGTTFRWFTGSCGGTAVGTGNNLSVSPTVNTTYYGRWENGCGNSTCQSVAITVNPLPVAPTSVSASATTVCSGANTTLSYVGGSGTTFRWYSGSCGGTLVGSGNNLVVSPTVNITYYGRWENGCGNSTCQSVAITVNPLPTAPTSVTATPAAICVGSSTTLSYVGGTGTTFNWYSGSCGGTLVGSGNNLSVSPAVNTTYYGRWENSCGNSSCQSVAVTVNPLPTTSAITGNNNVPCNAAGEVYSVTLTSGSSYAWTVPAGSTITGGATGPNNNQITVTFGSTNGNVTVVETNSNGCVGSMQSKAVTLSGCGLAANFVGSPLTVCQNGTVTFTDLSTGTTGSTTYSWNFGAGASPATANTVGPHTVTYTTSGTKTVSLTLVDGVTVTETKTNYITVNPLPVAPTSVSATATTICNGQSTTLSYTGGSGTTFGWYTASCGGTLVGTGNNLSVSPTVNTTYYGRWENSCGNSTCQSVAITVNPLPVAPTSVAATLTTVCSGSPTVLSYTGGSGTTFNWYSGSCGGTLIGSGNNLSVSPTVNTTYYGRWENGCGNSTCQSVAITVNPLPVAPTSVAATLTTICEGASTVLSYTGGSGTTFRWFTGSCGGVPVGTGNNLSVSPTVNTTYYGRWENGCGNSTCQSVAITVNPLPVAPTSVSATLTTVCSGSPTVLSYTGGSGTTFRWFTGSCGGTAVGTGNNLSVSPTVNTTYYGRWENGCGNSTCQQVAITVNPLPVAPTSVSATATTICSGQSTTLSYTGGSGTTFNWYTASCGGTLVGAGNNLSVSPTVNTTYYGRWENGCGNSTCQSVAITVNPLPVAPTSVSATLTTVCAGSPTVLSYVGGSGTTFNWYSGSCGGTLVGAGNNLSVSPTVNTTYYGRWENGCGNSTCQNVAITVNPLPVAPTSVSATATTICNGQSTTLSYTGGSGTTFRWFTGSCGGTAVGTGNNLSVSPTVNTTYYGRWENGCGNSTCQTVAITVNPLPNTSAITGNSTVACNAVGEVYSVTLTSGSSYAWTVPAGSTITGGATGPNNNQITVTFGSTNGNVTVVETNSNGCVGSMQSKAVTLAGCGLLANFSGSPTTICQNGTVTFTDLSTGTTGSTTYSWNFGAGASPATANTVGPHTVTYTTSGSKTVSLTLVDGASSTETKTNYITVNPLPVAPTSVAATLTTICEGQSTTLSYSGGSGTAFYWYSGSCGGTLVGLGNNLSVSPTVNTTYYGRWENGCGNSTCQSVAITVNPLPVAPTSVSATATTICSGQSTTLSYTGGSGTTFRWYTASCGGTLVGAGNNLSVSPTVNTTYYGRWENGCGNSTCQSVAITVNPLPVAPTSVSATATTICSGQSTTLSYTGGSGTTFNWYTASCGGTLVGAGNNLSVSPTVNTTYYGRWENGCGNSSCQSVAITVNPLPVAPTSVSASATTICSGQSTTLSYTGGSGTVFNWYSGSCGGTFVGSGFNLSVSPTVNTTYYGRWENSCGNSSCQSVAITVNPLPVAPTSVSATATTICNGQSTTLSYTGGSGTVFRWYTASCGGTLVGAGNNLSVSPTVNTTYYGRWENGCGNSTCQTVAITVNPLPSTSPIAGNSNVPCNAVGEVYSVVLTSGSSYAWTVPAGATITGGATGPNNNQITVTFGSTNGNVTVVETNANGCVGTMQSKAVTLSGCGLAANFSGSPTTICQNGTVTFTDLSTGTTGSTTYSWNFGAGATPATANTVGPHTVTYTTSGLKTVSLTLVDGASSTETKTDYITVNPLPVAPTSVSASLTTVCAGSPTILSYTGGSGTTFRWFTGSCGGTSVGVGNNLSVSPTVNTTYYGRWENGCGNSTCQSVAVTVNPLPVAPTSVAASQTTICSGQSTTLSYVGGSGTTFAWYTGSCGGTYVGSGFNLSVSPTVNTTYYGRWENSCGNSSCQSVAITVNPLPVAPTSVSATQTTVCAGSPTTLAYVGGSGTTFMWYTDACGGVNVGSGNNLTVSPTVNTTYYGRWENGCGNSTCQSVAITVNPLPVAPTSVSASAATICSGQSTTLSYVGGSGTNFRWYTASCGGTLVGAGNNLSVSPTVNTTYYGRWENSCGNSTCQSVAITVNPLPVAPTSVSATATTICSGQSTTLSYTGGSGTTFNWYTASCGGTLVGSGNNLSVSPTVNTTYYGRWENSCGNSSCQSVAITVNPLPVAPTSVSASSTTICAGGSTTLSYVGGSGTTFRWYTASCGGTLVGAGNDLVVSPAATTTYYGRWENGCGNSTCQSVTVTVNPVPNTSAIVGSPTPACNAVGVTYSVTLTPGSSYAWTVPAGAVITGGATGPNNNQITVTFGNTNGNVTVVETNAFSCVGPMRSQTISLVGCGLAANFDAFPTTVCEGESVLFTNISTGTTGSTTYSWNFGADANPATATGAGPHSVTYTTPGLKTVSLTITDGASSTETKPDFITVNPLPLAAGTISGEATVCQGQNGVAYSVDAITNATSYNWSYSGTGATINGNSNNITIDFAANATPGNLTVVGVNACGNGTVSADFAISINPLPSTPGVIDGQAIVCQGETGVVYSVPAITNATSYVWTYSGTGATINGTGDNVTIDFATNATSGNLTVYGVNACGNGVASANYPVQVNLLPGNAGTIMGANTVCQGESNLTYTVAPIDDAVTYNWSYSGTGATIIGNAETVTINFASDATAGDLTVYGVNACGNGVPSAPFAIDVNPLPAAAGTISGQATVCQGENNVQYSVAAIADATSYAWTYSGTGATIFGTTNDVTINFAPNATAGVLTVYGQNACGNGVASADFAISVNNLPTAPTMVDANDLDICLGESVTLSYTGGNGDVFRWYSASCGVDLVGTGNNLVVTPNHSGVNTFYGRWENACGVSTCETVSINVNDLPIADAGANFTISYGTSTTLAAADGGSSTYSYSWEPAIMLIDPNVQYPQTVELYVATVFTLTVQDLVTGCINTDQVTVGIDGGPLNIVSVTANPTVVCEGDPVQLDVLPSGGAGGYLFDWNDGSVSISAEQNPIVNPTVTTTYTVTVISGTESATESVVVTVNPKPVTPVITYDAGILTSDATDGNQWYYEGVAIPGATDATYEPTANGNYYVVVTNSNGCASDPSNIINVIDVSAKPMQIEAVVNVYPNPNNGSFYVSMRGFNTGVSVMLVNTQGQVTYSEKLTVNGEELLSIALPDYAKGIYYLRIVTANKVMVQKIVVN